MKRVFADTLYWIAAANPFDSWRSAAQRAKQELGPALLVTTDEVLSEFMTADAQIIAAVLAGRREAFAELVIRYERAVHAGE